MKTNQQILHLLGNTVADWAAERPDIIGYKVMYRSSPSTEWFEVSVILESTSYAKVNFSRCELAQAYCPECVIRISIERAINPKVLSSFCSACSRNPLLPNPIPDSLAEVFACISA